ncbi:MAG: asparagine synthetase B [Chitinophagales bacterium]|nr:asparagine synthetase B [Chitinophagales bacterium]
MKKILSISIFCIVYSPVFASMLFIPMDQKQANHLKSYGMAYWILSKNLKVDWMINYRGGSFAFPYFAEAENECVVRGITYEVMPDATYNNILSQIASPEVNEDIVKLEKAPKIAVYSPKNKEPWDDAVTLVLTYAEIPYDIIYDDDVLQGKLPLYDWLHLHHEDFTGQYGKFYAQYGNAAWYIRDVKDNEEIAARWGFKKVSQLKLMVAQKIRDYVAGGGFMFAMCSATDSYDIALAADGVDICDWMYDGDPPDPKAQQKLDFSKCFAFQNFTLIPNSMEYEFSNIDATTFRHVPMDQDYFTLFEFSAKWDPVPTMLCQDHTQIVKGFMGQTTSFRNEVLKSTDLIMGENKAAGEARYVHGEYGNGTWTFYGGHDPEDYQHQVGDPPTDLALHPNSPGYRLILNNVLFPAARKKKQKT